MLVVFLFTLKKALSRMETLENRTSSRRRGLAGVLREVLGFIQQYRAHVCQVGMEVSLDAAI